MNVQQVLKIQETNGNLSILSNKFLFMSLPNFKTYIWKRKELNHFCWGKKLENLKCFSKHIQQDRKVYLCHTRNPADLGQAEWSLWERKTRTVSYRVFIRRLSNIYTYIYTCVCLFIYFLNVSNCWYTKLLTLTRVTYADSLLAYRGNIEKERK